jgi:hypothetical protein
MFRPLKKTISLFFLVIYLLSITQLTELLKLPLLIEHYKEHKQQDATLNLSEFLYMHYAHGNVKDADYEKDMKLPFKSMMSAKIAYVSFFVPFPVFNQNLIMYLKIDTQQFSNYSFIYSAAYLCCIWNPPKSC